MALKSKKELLEDMCNSFGMAILKLEIDKVVFGRCKKDEVVAATRKEVLGQMSVITVTAEEALKRTEEGIKATQKLLDITLKMLRAQNEIRD